MTSPSMAVLCRECKCDLIDFADKRKLWDGGQRTGVEAGEPKVTEDDFAGSWLYPSDRGGGRFRVTLSP
jgi:hypothetical protein